MSNLTLNQNAKSYRVGSKKAVERAFATSALPTPDAEMLRFVQESENSLVCHNCETNVGYLTGERNGFGPLVLARAFDVEDDDRERFGTSVAVCTSCARKGGLTPVNL